VRFAVTKSWRKSG